jgi:hypothetical protein
MDFAPFVMAHDPLKMTIAEARSEVDHAWTASYSPERNAEALEQVRDAPLEYRIGHLVARFFFRGIYFPQMNKRAWVKMMVENRRNILDLAGEGFKLWRKGRQKTHPPQPLVAASTTHAGGAGRARGRQ